MGLYLFPRKTRTPVGFSTVKSGTLCKLFRLPEVSTALWEEGPYAHCLLTDLPALLPTPTCAPYGTCARLIDSHFASLCLGNFLVTSEAQPAGAVVRKVFTCWDLVLRAACS